MYEGAIYMMWIRKYLITCLIAIVVTIIMISNLPELMSLPQKLPREWFFKVVTVGAIFTWVLSHPRQWMRW